MEISYIIVIKISKIMVCKKLDRLEHLIFYNMAF